METETDIINIDCGKLIREMLSSAIVIDSFRANIRHESMMIIDSILDRNIISNDKKQIVRDIKEYIMKYTSGESIKSPERNGDISFGILAIISSLRITNDTSYHNTYKNAIIFSVRHINNVYKQPSDSDRLGTIIAYMIILEELERNYIIMREPFAEMKIMRDDNNERMFLELKKPLYISSHGSQISILTVPLITPEEAIGKTINFVSNKHHVAFFIDTESFPCKLAY